jgi:hypothetical protein
MKIDCLMGTYGRYTLVCESLACFLQQSALSQATLLIYNQHPVPLRFDHPRVRIVNEAPPAGSLRYIRQRMHELADPSADLIHWWDDDDLYLPWHLQDCLEHIAGHVAWKPASSWLSEGNAKFSRSVNTFEGSWVFRSDYLKSAPLHTHPTYIDHPVIRQTEEAKLLATTELAGRTSYIYRWATGAEHISAYRGGNSEEIQRDNLEQWRRRSSDVRADGILAPADLTLRWQQYLAGTGDLMTLKERVHNRERLRPFIRRVGLAKGKFGDLAGTRRRAASSNKECNDAYGLVRALLSDRGADDRSVVSKATERALLHRRSVNGVQICSALAEETEFHGVTPLIEPMITALCKKRPEAVPDDVRRVFVALASRHRRAAAAREKCVDQLLAAFASAGVPIILLKGAALAHRIYLNPELRPMDDIDVLIDPADTERAVAITRGLGYSFARRHQSRFAGRLHHLPQATIGQSGFQITLEIHTDAMSPDQAGSLTFATLAARPLPFQRGSGPDGIALGHTDMLRHLARHAFEPARRIRLKHLYDLWRYQAIFRDDIDWQELALRFPDVIVILRLVSYVFVREPAGARLFNAASGPVPAGLGLGMVPLSEIANADTGGIAKLADLFNPPAWWLHGFYGVPPENSLLICRTVRHPATLARWLARRLVAGTGVFAQAPGCIADQQGIRSLEVR